MVSYVHMVDGRLRLRLAAVKQNPARASALQEALRKTVGIQSATVNIVTGSVLIHYDEWQIAREELLDLFGVPSEMRVSPGQFPETVMRRQDIRHAIVNAVIHGVVGAVCQRMVGFALSRRLPF